MLSKHHNSTFSFFSFKFNYFLCLFRNSTSFVGEGDGLKIKNLFHFIGDISTSFLHVILYLGNVSCIKINFSLITRFYRAYKLFPWLVVSWIRTANLFITQLPVDTIDIFNTDWNVSDENLSQAWQQLGAFIGKLIMVQCKLSYYHTMHQHDMVISISNQESKSLSSCFIWDRDHSFIYSSQLYQFFTFTASPKSLQHLCVLTVRHVLGEGRAWEKLQDSLKQLHAHTILPDPILDLLHFRWVCHIVPVLYIDSQTS